MCAPHIKIKLSMLHIELGDIVVPVSTVAKNIGIFFDDPLSMNNQVQHICRVAYIHCIGKIQNLLDRKATEIMIHTYITCCFDNKNCLLYGIFDHLLTKLQRVQNAAAWLIIKTKKHDHITAVLIDLHWLPIIQRIEYKLLLLTFRSLHGLAALYITDLLIRYEPTHAEDSTMQTMYAGRKRHFRVLLHASGTIFRSPCVPQTPSVLSRSN